MPTRHLILNNTSSAYNNINGLFSEYRELQYLQTAYLQKGFWTTQSSLNNKYDNVSLKICFVVRNLQNKKKFKKNRWTRVQQCKACVENRKAQDNRPALERNKNEVWTRTHAYFAGHFLYNQLLFIVVDSFFKLFKRLEIISTNTKSSLKLHWNTTWTVCYS